MRTLDAVEDVIGPKRDGAEANFVGRSPEAAGVTYDRSTSGVLGRVWRAKWRPNAIRDSIAKLQPFAHAANARIEVVEHMTETDVRVDIELRGVLVRLEDSVHGWFGFGADMVAKAYWIMGSGPEFAIYRGLHREKLFRRDKERGRPPPVRFHDPRLAELSPNDLTFVGPDEPAATVAAVNSHARTLLRECFRTDGGAVFSNGRLIRMYPRLKTIGLTIDAIVEIASFGRREFCSPFEGIADAQYIAPLGRFGGRSGPAYAVPIGAHTVGFAPRRDGATVVHTASLRVEAGEPFEATLGGEPHPAVLERERGRRAVEELTGVGPGVLSYDGSMVRLVFDGSVDRIRVMSGARLLVAMAGNRSLGAFR